MKLMEDKIKIEITPTIQGIISAEKESGMSLMNMMGRFLSLTNIRILMKYISNIKTDEDFNKAVQDHKLSAIGDMLIKSMVDTGFLDIPQEEMEKAQKQA